MTKRQDRFIGETDDVIIEQLGSTIIAPRLSPRAWRVIDERLSAIREYSETGDRSVLVRAGLAPDRPSANAQGGEHPSTPPE